MVVVSNYECVECPVQYLKTKNFYGPVRALSWDGWVMYCENLRKKELEYIISRHGTIKLYILTESIPRGRFVYDPNSNYHQNVKEGLRTRLCRDLIHATCPPNINHCKQCQHFNTLLNHLREKGILIVDCALCPLHLLRCQQQDVSTINEIRRLAATICLCLNTYRYLEIAPNTSIITIFPVNCGFDHEMLKILEELEHPKYEIIQRRISKLKLSERIKGRLMFKFKKKELEDLIKQIIGDC